MSSARLAIVAVLAAVVSGAATAWVINLGHDQRAQRESRYATPRVPEAPLGDLAGPAMATGALQVRNPLEGDADAVAKGQALFVRMNCAGCHGYDAKGGMGPSLVDRYWRYGGAPEQIYLSIAQGRPQGMPAWGVALPKRSVWELVAYVQSLGGAFPYDEAQAGREGDLGQKPGAADQP